MRDIVYILLFCMLSLGISCLYADDYVDDVYVWQPVKKQKSADRKGSVNQEMVVQEVNGVPAVTTTVKQSPVTSPAQTNQAQTGKPVVRIIQEKDTVVKAVIHRP